MNKLTAITSDLNALKSIANTDLQALAFKLLTLNVEVVSLLTDGYNDWPTAEEHDEVGYGCAGFELHFRGRQSNLVGLEKDAIHPGELSKLFKVIDEMTKAGFEAALTTRHGGEFVLIVIG